MNADFAELPPDLPIPEDDGAAEHLTEMSVPTLTLPSTQGGPVDLSAAGRGRLVAYLYPRTGVPGRSLPTGWDDIPGARGCTPQSCAYRESISEFSWLGATVVGISAQTPGEQREFTEREHIPFPLLSDSGLRLADALRLPTFEAEGMTLYKRLTFVAEGGKIAKVFYPVFPPDRDAGEVLAWLHRRRA
ncbi:MAG TPA: peroxiredoxin [Solirubrobacterales bacterium]